MRGKQKHPSERVRDWVEQKNYSVELLAHRCKTNGGYIRRIIRTGRIGPRMAKRIEAATGIPWIDWFDEVK